MGKPILFWGASKRDSVDFPDSAKRLAGYELRRVQEGLEPSNWKVINVGAGITGIHEIRVIDPESSGTYRIMYVVKFESAIYVLHCFQKKTQKLAEVEKRIIRERFFDVRSYVQAAATRKGRVE